MTRSLLIYFAYEIIGLCLECFLVRSLSQNSIKSAWDWIGVVMGYVNRHILLGDWLLFPVAFYFKQVTLGRIALLCCIIAYVFFWGGQQLRLLLALYSASDPYLIANAHRNSWIPTLWTFGPEQNNNSSEPAFPQHTASYIPVLFSMFCRRPVRQWLKWKRLRRWNPVTRYYSLRNNVSSTTEDDDADCKQKRSELTLRAPLYPLGGLSQEVLPNSATHPFSQPPIFNNTKSYDNVTCEQSTTASSETHVNSVTATQLDHSCDDNGAPTAALPKMHLQQAVSFANQLTNEPPSVLRLSSRQYLPPSDPLPPSETDVGVQPPHPGDLSVYYFSYTILLYLLNCFEAPDTLNVWFRHRVWPQRRTSSSTLTYSATLESSDNALCLNNVLEPLTDLSSQPQRCFFSASTAHNVVAPENFSCFSPHAVRQRWLTNYIAAQSASPVPFLKVIQLAHCSQLTDRFSIQNVLRRVRHKWKHQTVLKHSFFVAQIYLSPQHLEQHEFCTAASTIG